VAVYAAMSAEVDLDPLARRLLAEGVPVGYPRVDTGAAGRSMAFHLVTAPPTVPRGRPAIREPDAWAPVLLAPAVIVLPGLAYDRDGGRLGYGGGFYDRYLATVPEAVRLGVCLDELVVDQVPRERHDMGIHSVVTETSVYRCRDAHL
jgi:5-formyltetrahydrofolate cyclo-ligase